MTSDERSFPIPFSEILTICSSAESVGPEGADTYWAAIEVAAPVGMRFWADEVYPGGPYTGFGLLTLRTKVESRQW